MSKKALITGITGQDGSYLAELLLSKGYEVHGVVRRVAIEDPIHRLWRLRHILDRLKLHSGSLESYASIFNIVEEVLPDECYHLGAQSFVSYSFEDEFSTLNTNINGTHHVLTALKECTPKCRFYFAGSSEMFGNTSTSPQNEETPFNPRSLYGISKLASHYLVNNFHEKYDLYACSGITYNHESPRRGHQFVTRKITSGLAQIYTGSNKKISLGNIDAVRDWGYAPDYVKAMWMMLNNPSGPKNYVIATGIPHSVRDFLKFAFETVEMKYEDYISIDKDLFRPSEKVPLVGDASLIKKELGWHHTKSFKKIVEEMVHHDIEEMKESH